MGRGLSEDWTWIAKLADGTKIPEARALTIGAVPGELIRTLSLVCAHRGMRVDVEFPTGVGRVFVGDRLLYTVNPISPAVMQAPKQPLFFRRKSLLVGLAGAPAATQFHALGFVAHAGGQPHVAAIRVRPEGIDKSYHCDWPSSQARHVAGSAALI